MVPQPHPHPDGGRARAARRALWRRGDLRYMLRPNQRELYRVIRGWVEDPDVLVAAIRAQRRRGKSFCLSLVGTEFCLQRPGFLMRHSAPDAFNLTKYVIPNMKRILRDCPDDLRPEWVASQKLYRFPNGSEVHLAGLNDRRADAQRGMATDFAAIDEAGLVDDLEYAAKDVLLPQTEECGGTLVGASTPPRSPSHEFVKFYRDCEADGNAVRFSVYDEGLSEEEIDRKAKPYGGRDSVRFRREFGAEFVVDTELAIVPEWDSKLYAREPEESDLARFWHRYAAMDIGFRDNQVVLLARYDFEHARLEVMAELVCRGQETTSDLFAASLRKLVAGTWPQHCKAPDMGVYRWISDSSDANYRMDLSKFHGIHFWGTSKSTLTAMVNQLRLWVRQGRVWVDPSCANLLACLEGGVWVSEAKIGVDFGHAGKLGHYDALAALIYLVRNVDERTNPVPHAHGLGRETHLIRSQPQSGDAEAIKNVFRVPRPGMRRRSA